jgi:hypothetical protein
LSKAINSEEPQSERINLKMVNWLIRKETKMKPAVLVGILLILMGIVALSYQGLTYTKREKVLDIGPIQASKETRKTIPLPPVLGGLALAGGIALVIIGNKK